MTCPARSCPANAGCILRESNEVQFAATNEGLRAVSFSFPLVAVMYGVFMLACFILRHHVKFEDAQHFCCRGHHECGNASFLPFDWVDQLIYRGEKNMYRKKLRNQNRGPYYQCAMNAGHFEPPNKEAFEPKPYLIL